MIEISKNDIIMFKVLSKKAFAIITKINTEDDKINMKTLSCCTSTKGYYLQHKDILKNYGNDLKHFKETYPEYLL